LLKLPVYSADLSGEVLKTKSEVSTFSKPSLEKLMKADND